MNNNNSNNSNNHLIKEPKNGAKICGLTGAGDQVTFPTIIPVVIHSKCSGTSVETYAYLDGGSDCTFCTETLFQQLNTRGKETTLQINTINDERVVESHEIDDLEVSDMERKNFISLCRVYTSKSIPPSMKHIVTQEDIKACPHLQSRVEDIKAWPYLQSRVEDIKAWPYLQSRVEDIKAWPYLQSSVEDIKAWPYLQSRVEDIKAWPYLGTASKPNPRLTDGSVRFHPVSIVLNNDNRPEPDGTAGQPAVGF